MIEIVPAKNEIMSSQNIKFKTMGRHVIYMFKTGKIIIYYPSYMGFVFFLKS